MEFSVRCISALLLVLLSACAVHTQGQSSWTVHFQDPKVEMHMRTEQDVNFKISGIKSIESPDFYFLVNVTRPQLADVNKKITKQEIESGSDEWSDSFKISAIFLGKTNIYVQLVKENGETEDSKETVEVIITRQVRIIDHVFTGSVALLVSLLYINFGAALNIPALRGILMRPIGPAIGFVGQFIFMPLVSFGLGFWLFPDAPELHLGLYFTGVSPGGGASNIWAVILGGNIDMSIVMTAVSNFGAFGMMPFWIFTLGRVVFERAKLGVPYSKIATFAVALIVPLGIGLLIQKYSRRTTNVLVRLLKPISTCLILFIIIFAIVTNLYIFQLFSWQIIVAGLGLPWIGYTVGWIMAKLCRQTPPDALTIAIETGIQNTGISIFLLRFSLPQPEADLTTVIPVAVAIMTPVPLLILYIIQKIRNFRSTNSEKVAILPPSV